MAGKIKILTVCGCGLGSSLMVKTNIEAIAKELKLDASVEAGDVGTAKGRGAHLIVITKNWAHTIGTGVTVPIVVLNNAFDKNELKTALIKQLTGLGILKEE